VDTVDIHFAREMRMAEINNDRKILEKAKATKEAELRIYGTADAIITVTEEDWLHVSPYLKEKPTSSFQMSMVSTKPQFPLTTETACSLSGISTTLPTRMRSVFPGPNIPTGEGAPAQHRSHHRGKQPTEDIVALQSQDVIVTGYVPSTAPHLKMARVSVAPLRTARE